MSDLLTQPNLPEHKITTVVCQKQAAVYLNALSIETLSPVPQSRLPEETAEHADLLFCHLGQNLCAVSEEQTALIRALTDRGFSPVLTKEIGGAYPGDIRLNCLITPRYVFGSLKHLDRQLLTLLGDTGRRFVSVRQGYAKCSLCTVSESAFITEDEGLYRQLTALGLDVLRISAGDIRLSDRHYGFLGGASGKISKNTLAIFGSLNYHKDKEVILRFLDRHGVEPLYLLDAPVTDIGGILPIMEGV